MNVLLIEMPGAATCTVLFPKLEKEASRSLVSVAATAMMLGRS
jgi:hypothetical protein